MVGRAWELGRASKEAKNRLNQLKEMIGFILSDGEETYLIS